MAPKLRFALPLLAAALLVLGGCGGDTTVTLPIGGGGAVVTPGDPNIYLFDSGLASAGRVSFGGGSGGRGTVDAFVASGTVPAVCAGKTVRAFLSVSASDSIAAMPANYGVPIDQPVVGAMGPQLAANWADLLDGAIATSLTAATGLSNFFWSGSDDTGAATTHCSGWASTANNGWNGRHDLAGSTWLGTSASACTSTAAIVGICY